MGIPSLLFFVHPVLVGSVQDVPLAQASISSINGLMRRLLVDLPVMTALIEELVFRSLLFAPLGSLRRTLVVNAGLFTVWHGVAAYTSVLDTPLSHSPGLMLSYAGALGSVFVGGLVFAFVRWKTGSFIYSALTHWLTDALILVALWGVSHLSW
ncbi:MAG TPA: CPBP family intramembrane glutamic endopeptidase [Ktedonobacterales bacterium]|nr:CPBP family intramembrane glutamic endopeptidase [Ktedonobacterales bacterium]